MCFVERPVVALEAGGVVQSARRCRVGMVVGGAGGSRWVGRLGRLVQCSFFDDGRDISIGEAVSRSSTAAALGALNRTMFGQGPARAALGISHRVESSWIPGWTVHVPEAGSSTRAG